MKIEDFKQLPKDWIFKPYPAEGYNYEKIDFFDLSKEDKGSYHCRSCTLYHKNVECGGVWYCPNPKCKGSGGSWFRSTLKSYKELKVDGSHTIDEEEWDKKSDEYILNLVKKENNPVKLFRIKEEYLVTQWTYVKADSKEQAEQKLYEKDHHREEEIANLHYHTHFDSWEEVNESK